MRSKIKMLFCRRPGVGDAALHAGLVEESGRLRASFAGQLAFCYAYAVKDASLAKTAAGAFDAAERPFDAMLEIVSLRSDPFETLPSLLEGLGERLSDLIDANASAALVGNEHIILPGTGPLLVLIANRRLPQFTHAGFLKYWFDYHGPFAREHTPPDAGLYYRQFHADAAASETLARLTGLRICDFDGAAECYYPDADAVRGLMSRTEVVDRATVDEKEFVDHESCVTSVLAIAKDSTSHVAA